jgi:hypothetical protein
MIIPPVREPAVAQVPWTIGMASVDHRKEEGQKPDLRRLGSGLSRPPQADTRLTSGTARTRRAKGRVAIPILVEQRVILRRRAVVVKG